MDVTVTITTGGGKKANRESFSYTMKEVHTEQQVKVMFHEKFGHYFVGVVSLDDIKPRSKKNTA